MRKLPKLGEVVEGHEERDAIHIAIIPARLLTEVYPGSPVRLVDRKPGEKFYTVARTEKDSACIGVVDPFLKGYVDAGKTVWVFLKPNTVTDMRHHWEHPDFEDFKDDLDPGAEETFRYLKHGNSIEWMRNFAAEVDLGYQELLQHLSDFLDGGEDYIHIGVDTPYDKIDKMWECYEHITGQKVPKKSKSQPFSCSC